MQRAKNALLRIGAGQLVVPIRAGLPAARGDEGGDVAVDQAVGDAASGGGALERRQQVSRGEHMVVLQRRRQTMKTGIELVGETLEPEAGPAVLEQQAQLVEDLELRRLLRLERPLHAEPELRQA